MSKLSVVIPSRQPQYLNRTIEDLLAKSVEDIEIIVVLESLRNELASTAFGELVTIGFDDLDNHLAIHCG